MLNACKADISRILSPSVSAGSSSARSSQFHRPSDRSNNLQISTIGHEEPVVSAAAQVIGGESALSGSLVSLSPLEACQDKRLHQAQVHQQPVNSSAQFLDGLSSGVLNVLSKNPPQPVVHPSCHVADDVNQEFKELLLLQDKFIDYPSLDFYSQNLFDYEQGVAPAIVKGRLKAHFQFWVDIGAPSWVLDTICSGYVIPFDSLPSSVCLSNKRSALLHFVFVSSAISDLLKLGLVSEVYAPPTVISELKIRRRRTWLRRLGERLPLQRREN